MYGKIKIFNNQVENKVVIDDSGNVTVYTTSSDSNIDINGGEVTILFPKTVIFDKSKKGDNKAVIRNNCLADRTNRAGFEHREVEIAEQKTVFSVKELLRELHGTAADCVPIKVLGLTDEKFISNSYIIIEDEITKQVKGFAYKTFAYTGMNFRCKQKQFRGIGETSIGEKFTHPYICKEGVISNVENGLVYVRFGLVEAPFNLETIRNGALTSQEVNFLDKKGLLKTLYCPLVDSVGNVKRIEW